MYHRDAPASVIYTLSYTTLFRSLILQLRVLNPAFLNLGVFVDLIGNKRLHFQFQIANSALLALGLLGQLAILEPLQLRLKKTLFLRSEEHTSELQSRGHLVCRLLLEKKNTQ